MKQPELGIYIARLRQQKKLTQKDLADEINVDIRTIQRIESGKVAPRMYTIKLLSEVLGSDIEYCSAEEDKNVTTNDDTFTQQIRWSFILGVIFAINYVPVMFNIITRSFNPFINLLLVLIHMSTIIFTIRGFYLIGLRSNNYILATTSVLAMILLPLLSIVNLQDSRLFNPTTTYLIFNLACINAITQGVGFIFQGYRQKNIYKANLYKLGGALAIVQSILFFSTKFEIIITALVLSSLGNILALVILKSEYREPENAEEKIIGHTAIG